MADPLTKNRDFSEINSKVLTDVPELQIHVKKWLIKSTIVKFKRGVSQYVEFDSTTENITDKMFKFVLKTLYVKLNYTSKQNYEQPSTRWYAVKDYWSKIITYVEYSTRKDTITIRFELNSRDSWLVSEVVGRKR